jgi:KDO2-lipid IV(A) lauroyltransferase
MQKAFEEVGDCTKTPLDPLFCVRGYFVNHYVNQLLILLFPRLSMRSMVPYHRWEGLDVLNDLRERGTGCVLIHAHFGPVHLPLVHMALMGWPVKQLGFLRPPERLSAVGRHVAYRLRGKYEAMIPADIIQADSYLGSAFRHLKRGGVLFMTGDGAGGADFRGHHEPFPFLGRDVLFSFGPVRMASKVAVPLIPIVTTEDDSGPAMYVTRVCPPIELGDSTEAEAVSAFVERLRGVAEAKPYLWHFFDEFAVGARSPRQDSSSGAT